MKKFVKKYSQSLWNGRSIYALLEIIQLIIFKIRMKAIILFAIIFVVSYAQTTCDLNSVVVTGNAEVRVEPNIAIMEINVKALAKQTSQALNQMNQMVQEVFTIFKENGIDEKDYSTSNLNFSPQYDYSSGQSFLVGQQASQQLSVTIRNIDTTNKNKVGQLVEDLANSIKGIQIQSVSFDQSDKSLGVKKARKEAYQSALKKAQQLASLSGRKVSEVKRIESIDGNSYVPYRSQALAATHLGLLIPTKDVLVSEQLSIVFTLI